MSVSRRSFLQSTAVVAGAAVVVGPAARAVAGDRSGHSSTSSTVAPSTNDDGGDDAAPAPAAGPIIAYVDGTSVTVLSGDREVTRTDAELARRIARAAKNDS